MSAIYMYLIMRNAHLKLNINPDWKHYAYTEVCGEKNNVMFYSHFRNMIRTSWVKIQWATFGFNKVLLFWEKNLIEGFAKKNYDIKILRWQYHLLNWKVYYHFVTLDKDENDESLLKNTIGNRCNVNTILIFFAILKVLR